LCNKDTDKAYYIDMQNMFTQKILLAGLAVAVVIGGVVFYNSQGEETPPANLDAVTERAKDMKENSQPARTAVIATTSAPTIVTPQPEPEPVVDVTPAVTITPEPKPVVVTPPAPVPDPTPTTPVATTPVEPVPPPTPAPAGVTKAEVATHNTSGSCWSSINGSVYDLTDYISRHPGGKSRIIDICGKDGTRSFNGQHAGSRTPERILSGYYIDDLVS
jgi:outer membrane biosynthesis protein TonB